MKLKIAHIVKKFPLKDVLNDISYTFQTGKFYALLGENGTGKSTLANILSGFITPTSGDLFIDDNQVFFTHPVDAQLYKIELVRQRPLLANELTVKENILLGHEHTDFREEFLLYPIPLHKKVLKLTASERFFTSLAASLITQPHFIILDEPSSSLDIDQRNTLYTYLRKLVKNNVGVFVISHDRLEALKIADTVIELQNGKIHKVTHFIEDTFSEKIQQANNTQPPTDEVAFEVQHLTARPIDRSALFDGSFIVKKGTITAICGQRESGLETLEDIITGMAPEKSKNTHFYLFGKKISNITPPLLRQNRTAIIPFDRTFRGSNPKLTIEEMLTIHYNGTLKTQKKYASSIIKKAGITIQLDEKVENLSGGMLQRLIAFRELETNPRFLILCSPTRGMDTKSAKDFTLLIQQVAQSGTAILVLGDSSSFLAQIASSTYTLRSGHIVLSSGGVL